MQRPSTFSSTSRMPSPRSVSAFGSAPSVSAALVAPTSSAAPRAPDIVMKITANPAKARLYFDDAELPSNPYVGLVPSAGAKHILRAEAPGYVARVVAIDLDKSTSFA